MDIKVPRLAIAGLAGDAGKTIVSLSLLATLKQKGLSISAFKKGPDYIDAAWLSHVSGTTCRNLDSYLTDPTEVLASFVNNTKDADIAIIEGNRGLFDGKDIYGTHSTAQLAKLLYAPIILVVNCTKATRTIAALVRGCQLFDPDLNIAGVILNNIAGERHKKIISDSIENICKIPVVGAIPKLKEDSSLIPGRHLGLVPPTEFDEAAELNGRLVQIAGNYLDVDKLYEIAKAAPKLIADIAKPATAKSPMVKIGYFSDSVFTFYYPENLEMLQNAGAELVKISSLEDNNLPDIDGLYIGGGFPETHAEQLAKNETLMKAVKNAAEKGLPIYAECGGLIYLCRSIRWNNKSFPMAGLFALDLTMQLKPVGHGYSLAEVEKPNPFYEVGDVIKGHEFHYSGIMNEPENLNTCLKLSTGSGLGNKTDGLVYKNTMACYMHIHASGVKEWAESLVVASIKYKSSAGEGKDGNFNVSHRRNGVAA